MIYFGYMGEDDGFVNYSGSDIGEKADMGNQGKSITFTDDEFFDATYMHLDGNDQVVDAYIDGKAEHFSAGNIQATHAEGKIFGLGERAEEGEEGGPNITWEYGAGEGQTYGGEIKLTEFCEPAWAYDENAEPGTYVNCVETNGDDLVQEGLPFGVYQGAQGGEAWAAQGVKASFEITPYEDYILDDYDLIVDPNDVNVLINGAGGDEGAEFEFDMPENASIHIVASFIYVGDDALMFEQCDPENDDDCDGDLPVIVQAVSDDAPENVVLRISYGDGEEYDEAWETFAKELFGSAEAYEEYIDSLDGDYSDAEIISMILKEYGSIIPLNFDISLFDIETGEHVDYEGEGITITFTASDYLNWFGEQLGEGYDGDVEFMVAHLKSDGTVEFIPLTANEDGTLTLTVKSLSPFAFVVRAVKDAPDNGNPATLDNIVVYACAGLAVLTIVGASIFVARKSLRK
jgi:hypothetical protein